MKKPNVIIFLTVRVFVKNTWRFLRSRVGCSMVIKVLCTKLLFSIMKKKQKSIQ